MRSYGVDHAGNVTSVVKDSECELCIADRYTHWYAEDEDGWVADCEVCSVPMVVWNEHGTDPAPGVREHLFSMLAAAADDRFGKGNWSRDEVMRQIPSHFHAHARDPEWFAQRAMRPMSRYTGVGGDRVERG